MISPDENNDSPQLDYSPEQKEKLRSILNQFSSTISRTNKQNFEDVTKRKTTSTLRYDTEDIAKWLQNPIIYEKQLRQLSNYFYNHSSIYRLVIRYMALMPTYAYAVVPTQTPNKIDISKYQKNYMQTLQYVDKLMQKKEFIKAMLIAFKEDYFFGYEHETDDSFFVQTLDANYCKVSSIEDGCLNFAYDFSYFDSNKDQLDLFPEEFRKNYQIYRDSSGTDKKQWIELDSTKTMCFKVNPEVYYPLVPFSTIFDAIVDLDEYKKIKKVSSLNDNFMALVQKIPMDEKNPDINKFLIDLELAMSFHQMADEALPDGISIITSPMDIDSIKTTKGNTDSRNVQDAYTTALTDAGISQFIFNSEKNTSIGLAKSIMADEQIVFSMLRQIEGWINRKLKNRTGSYKFKVNMLDITVFNVSDKQKEYLAAAQYGIPVKLEAGASLGLSPLDFINKVQLENEVLGLHDKLMPLQSSHTQGSDDKESGTPTKSDNEISDSGQQSRDRDSDSRKAEG